MTIEAMTLKTTPKTLNKAQLTHVKSRVVALGKAVALKKSLFADAVIHDWVEPEMPASDAADHRQQQQ